MLFRLLSSLCLCRFSLRLGNLKKEKKGGICISAGQEATVRTGHGKIDCLQIGKGVCQGCILSPCLFNLYAEYIMRNAGLGEAQAGIKIPGRNIYSFRYAGDATLWQKRKKN